MAGGSIERKGGHLPRLVPIGDAVEDTAVGMQADKERMADLPVLVQQFQMAVSVRDSIDEDAVRIGEAADDEKLVSRRAAQGVRGLPLKETA